MSWADNAPASIPLGIKKKKMGDIRKDSQLPGYVEWARGDKAGPPQI